MAAIDFVTTPYELSHGASPRGRGSWAFCPFHLRNANDANDYTLLSASVTFTEAKRWARVQIAERVTWRRASGLPTAPSCVTLWAVLG